MATKTKKTRTPFEMLPIVPLLVAEDLLSQPYTGIEFGRKGVPDYVQKRVEEARKTATPEQKQQFITLVERMSENFYTRDLKHNPVRKCLEAGNLDQFRVWVSHWMAGYLSSPEGFLRKFGADNQVI